MIQYTGVQKYFLTERVGEIMETRPYIPWDLINNFMIDVLKAYGVPEEDARICTDVLLESDRRGIESHGCNRLNPFIWIESKMEHYFL